MQQSFNFTLTSLDVFTRVFWKKSWVTSDLQHEEEEEEEEDAADGGGGGGGGGEKDDEEDQL